MRVRCAAFCSGWPARTLGLLLVGLLLAGCSPTSFVGRTYDNFTAYYNTFHNAKAAFETGMQSVRESERPIDRTRYLPVFPAPPEGTATEPFDKAIQKSADVLRQHPQSKWVDDALLLIGKSYFYQRNYVGAEQKFREVLALTAAPRAAEARFWLARTLVTADRRGEAAEAIQVGLEAEADGSWQARLRLVQGELRARQERWAEATEALQAGLAMGLPDEVAARGAFLLAQVQVTQGNTGAAREAYRAVLSRDPRYELAFAARLGSIELQGIHGSADAALERLRGLEKDEKNFEMRGDMAVVRARILKAQGQSQAAQQVLTEILRGEEAPSGASAGRVHYTLASIYRDAYQDFSRAAAHFDTARTSLRTPAGGAGEGQSGLRAQRIPTAPTDADEQATRYRSLADRAEEVTRLDSLLRLGRMPPSEFRDFVVELQEKRAAAQEAARERRETQGQRLRRREAGRDGLDGARQRSVQAAAQTAGTDAGFLFHRDPARVQEGRRQFRRTWGDRPLVDNWRRRADIRSQGALAEGEAVPDSAVGGEAETSTEARTQSLLQQSDLDLSDVPRDSSSLAAMEADRAVARYELGNALFLSAGRPDSAATWYRRVVEDHGDHPVARRALYALAEAHQAQGDTVRAERVYAQVIERYPASVFAERARQRLGTVALQTGRPRAARADSAYAVAYGLWEREEIGTALPAMVEVAQRYPDTDAAPRALLAAGTMYWRALQQPHPDSLHRRYAAHLRRAVPADSGQGGLPSDTMRAGSSSDSLSAEGATTAQLDTTRADTVAAMGHDGQVAPDSSSEGETELAAKPDSAAAAPDTARPTAKDGRAPLTRLLSYLADRYGETPQAERARTLMETLAASDSAQADSVRARGTSPQPPASQAETRGRGTASPDSVQSRGRPVEPEPRRN